MYIYIYIHIHIYIDSTCQSSKLPTFNRTGVGHLGSLPRRVGVRVGGESPGGLPKRLAGRQVPVRALTSVCGMRAQWWMPPTLHSRLRTNEIQG